MHKYAIEIFYSEEDQGYISEVPELPGCSAFGKTEEEALEEIKMAMELWLETAKKKAEESHNHMEKNSLRYSIKRPIVPHVPNRLAYNTHLPVACLSISMRILWTDPR